MNFQPLAAMFNLDYIRITHPFDAMDNPSLLEIRYDEFNSKETRREFICPRVDFSYKGKRYFGFVPVSTRIEVFDSWSVSRRTNVLNEDEMMQNLIKMIQSRVSILDKEEENN